MLLFVLKGVANRLTLPLKLVASTNMNSKSSNPKKMCKESAKMIITKKTKSTEKLKTFYHAPPLSKHIRRNESIQTQLVHYLTFNTEPLNKRKHKTKLTDLVVRLMRIT